MDSCETRQDIKKILKERIDATSIITSKAKSRTELVEEPQLDTSANKHQLLKNSKKELIVRQ